MAELNELHKAHIRILGSKLTFEDAIRQYNAIKESVERESGKRYNEATQELEEAKDAGQN